MLEVFFSLKKTRNVYLHTLIPNKVRNPTYFEPSVAFMDKKGTTFMLKSTKLNNIYLHTLVPNKVRNPTYFEPYVAFMNQKLPVSCNGPVSKY